MELKFTLLMSVYHKDNPVFLEQALESIWDKQTLKPDQIVLVQDGPLTPSLEEVIERFLPGKPVHCIKLPKNRGLGEALNIGLRSCAYDLVARMDSDDIAFAHRFETQLPLFEKYPDLDAIGACIDEFEGSPTNVVSQRKPPRTPEELLQYAGKRCPFNHPTVVFKKSSLLKSGGYLHFPLLEDYHLWVRMLADGARFYNVQESLLLFRQSSDTYFKRGGLKYALTEVRLEWMMLRLGIMKWWVFLYLVPAKFLTRIAPKWLRRQVYARLVRSN